MYKEKCVCGCVCMYVCVGGGVCECVCVCVREGAREKLALKVYVAWTYFTCSVQQLFSVSTVKLNSFWVLYKFFSIKSTIKKRISTNWDNGADRFSAVCRNGSWLLLQEFWVMGSLWGPTCRKKKKKQNGYLGQTLGVPENYECGPLF